jgi:isopentenyl diphosphate isomerase/L-lactate dehydrogenase-like FMN-dependent dehydrogenase
LGTLEEKVRTSLTRRKALASFAAFVAGSPLLHAQLDPHGVLAGHRRIPGLDEMETVFDFEPLFNANIPLATTDYTYHGDGSEFTLRRNRQAFDWVDIVAGKGVDAKAVDLSTTILGQQMKYPLFISPNSNQVPLHPDGEAGTHRGAAAASNTLMMISNVASLPVEKIVPAAASPCWFQFYPREDLDQSLEVIDHAQSNGCPAVIVTVDQTASYFERDLHDRNLGGAVRGPARGRAGTPAADPEAGPAGAGRGAAGGRAGGRDRGSTVTGLARYHLGVSRMWQSWDYLDAIHKFIKGPMIVKGILTPEDAELCVQHGADAIIVSNHGGRSMDYGPSTLEVLPEIAATVRGRIPVLVDSGFRRGSDVFKALALGANAVGIGRANRFGLGAFGAPGVQRVLEIMQRELVMTAAMAGRSTLASIDKTAVKVNFV